MRVVSLYDFDDWAIHNVGKALVAPAAARGVELVLEHEQRFLREPRACDVLHFGYSWIRRGGFDYRRYAPALTVTVHDPLEVSNFRNRFDWARLPMRPFNYHDFDRVSVISPEMVGVLRDRYDTPPYLTPTFPYDADAVLAAGCEAAARPGGGTVRFTAVVAGSAYESWGEVRERLRGWQGYARDERGRPSLRQLGSMFIRKRRKNQPWLTRLAAHVGRLPNAAADFRTGADQAKLARDAYLRRLAGADVYVCTSYMEGGPLPVMEAVLAGLAVLTTPVGQTEQWVTHGENGFFCRTYRDFARAAERYAREPELLARHKAASRAMAARKAFDFEPWHRFFLGR